LNCITDYNKKGSISYIYTYSKENIDIYMNNIKFSGSGTGIGNNHISYGGLIAEYGLLLKYNQFIWIILFLIY